MTVRRSFINRLSVELAEIARAKVAAVAVDASTLTPAEAGFLDVATSKDKEVFRSGWPDFLVENDEGRFIGVEVKTDKDEVRPSQARMFAALEKMGMPVFVWNPSAPARLAPWRRYMQQHEARRTEATHRRLQQPKTRHQRIGRVAKMSDAALDRYETEQGLDSSSPAVLTAGPEQEANR